MWLILLVLLVVVSIILLLQRDTLLKVKQATVTTNPTTGLVSGRYRIWVSGKDDDGNPGRYYLIAFGMGKQQSSNIVGVVFWYFRPEGDLADLTPTTAPLYLSPIGGIANTVFTEYFNVQILKNKLALAPSGATYAGTVISVCNDATQCVPKILRFDSTIGGTVFNYEVHDSGFRLYQEGNPNSYIVVGNSLCPVGPLPQGVSRPIVGAYEFARSSCTSLPTTKPGGPRFALISDTNASVLHFTK